MEEFDFDQGLKETASFARDKVENLLYKTTDRFGKTLGKIAIISGVFLLVAMVFIFLNITLAILISQWIGCNYSLGFLIVALFYLLLLCVLWLVSPVIKAIIYGKVASVAIKKVAEAGIQIDTALPDNLKRSGYEKERLSMVLSQKIDKDAVDSLIDHTEKKCANGEIILKRNIYYVKTHFKSILLTMSKNKAIGVLSKNKYIGMGMGLVNSIKNRKNVKSLGTQSNRVENNKSSKCILGGMAILTILAPFIKSFLWSMAISKVKRMILNRILPFKKKRK